MTDREKLIELLMQKGFGVEGSRIASDHLIKNGVTVAVKTSPTEKSQWIPFDSTKPIDGQSVLGITDEGEMAVYQFDADWKACLCQYGGLSKTFNVTHWMPLPEPPKKEIKNETT